MRSRCVLRCVAVCVCRVAVCCVLQVCVSAVPWVGMDINDRMYQIG